jgi:hypothetical protein
MNSFGPVSLGLNHCTTAEARCGVGGDGYPGHAEGGQRRHAQLDAGSAGCVFGGQARISVNGNGSLMADYILSSAEGPLFL